MSEMGQKQIEAEAERILDSLQIERNLEPAEAIAVLGSALTMLIVHRYKDPRDVAEKVAGLLIEAATEGRTLQ